MVSAKLPIKKMSYVPYKTKDDIIVKHKCQFNMFNTITTKYMHGTVKSSI